jgi:sugar lactone lactonase YvrE
MLALRPHLRLLSIFAVVALSALPVSAAWAQEVSWPPPLPGANNGSVSFTGKSLLRIPDSVAEQVGKEGIAEFEVAKTPPRVDFAYHQHLGKDAVNRRLWSSWGDICVAGDGAVYCAIGDHGNAVGGDARCFLYKWDPKKKQLQQIVDMNEVVPPREGQPAWSKVHARIDEGPDGAIYFCCTLNDGNRAILPDYHWNKKLPGGQIYRYDPETGKTAVFANLPPKRCTATSLVDHQRGIWWCNLEAGPQGLWGLDLNTKEVVYQAPGGSMTFNRNFALGGDGSVYFNGAGGIWKYDAKTGKLAATGAAIPESPGMRSSTRESKDGVIYGTTHKTNQLFKYDVDKNKVTLLGPTWLTGQYTTVTMLSPDERFVYYLPGSHGKAWTYGTPVVQYDIASGRRKVIAFLAETMEKKLGYVPGGTYGAKLSEDGSTLYVNFNGHAADGKRPEQMRPIGFGLCGFAAIHIPESER